jgi:hypothetical protein
MWTEIQIMRSEAFLCGQKFRLSGQKLFYLDRNSDYPVRNFFMWSEIQIIRSEIFLCGQKLRLSGQKFFYVDRNSDFLFGQKFRLSGQKFFYAVRTSNYPVVKLFIRSKMMHNKYIQMLV